MMRNPILGGALALGVGMIGLVGCPSDDVGDGKNNTGNSAMCMPGSMVSCGCPTDATMMHSCLPDGSGYQPCTCPGGNAGMGAGNAMMPAGTGGQMATGTGGSMVMAGTGGMGMMLGTGGVMSVPMGTGGMAMMAGTGGVMAGTGGMAMMGGSGGTGVMQGMDDAETSMLRDLCVSEINKYRAMLTDAPPLVRATADQEACSDMGAMYDGDMMVAHGFFRKGGGCIQSTGLGAQDTCPGWPVGGSGFGAYATVADALKSCLMQMWAEGDPPEGRDACTQDVNGCFQMHGHYLNMSNPKATAASCAFYKMSDGKSWWMNQDFVVKWF
jgi:hypothetical protein